MVCSEHLGAERYAPAHDAAKSMEAPALFVWRWTYSPMA